jgi:hypothetical protein
MNEAVARSRAPWPDRLRFTGPDEPPRWPPRALFLIPLDHPAGVIKYLHRRKVQSIARMLALVRSSSAAVAVERHRLANGGALPASLDQLVPSLLPGVPIDPFSGRPVRYAPRAHEYSVYSVGENGADDGGSVGAASAVPGVDRSDGSKDLGVRVNLQNRRTP